MTDSAPFCHARSSHVRSRHLRSRPSDRSVWFAVACALVLLPGCARAPSVADCKQVLPSFVEDLVVGTTEAGSRTCEGQAFSIPIVAEMAKEEGSWKINRAWVDGNLTTAKDLELQVNQEQLQRAAQEIGEDAVDALGKAGKAVKGFLDDLTN